MTKKISKKFKVVTLGCRTNQYESQAFSDQLQSLGYEKALEHESAEVCIVNTCTVTQSADSSSRRAIRQLARENPGSRLVVTGCFAEAKPEFTQKMEGVEFVVSNKEKEQLIQKLFPDESTPEFSIKQFEAHTRAFVKVQDGCNSFCTYCIIPYVRGRSRSRTVDDIIREVQNLITSGYQEIVLTGINIGDFDGGVKEGEKPVRLATLVRIVDAISGVKRLRVSSIDPDEVDDDLADAILNGKNTCPSMHIVLQSGSNLILKRMNRKYTRQVFLETVHRLKKANPLFTFTTDIIVGFPGETESDFLDTLSVMCEVEFAKVHMFPYSDRERTRAYLMPNKVSPEIIGRRKSELLRAAEVSSFKLREHFIGQIMSVLTEQIDPNARDVISGHTSNFLEVFLPKENLKPNQLIEVRLVENTANGFKGIHVY